jgi:hypothetical protein
MKFLYEYSGWVICATLGLGLILIFFGIKHSQKQQNQCKQAGGVYVVTRYNYVCLRPDAVIKMKEVE